MNGEFRIGPWLVQPSLNIITRGDTTVHLEPKVMEVLVCLSERAGEVVPRTDLLKAIWPGTFVTDDALKRCVLALRRAFDDDANKPKVIETIPKRGYRMIAAVQPSLEEAVPFPRIFPPESDFLPAMRHSVGREKERAELVASFESVAAGCGVMVCVAGEPGIGKTTLVEDFLSDLPTSGKSFRLAKGRCSERLAGSEAYLPFLEALDSLLGAEGRGTAGKLRAIAPSWYAQLFPHPESDSSPRMQEYAGTATQERVKRELGAFLQEVTRQEPLVLFFDDIHWTDPSTIDLLSYLATKFDRTKILLIVTYRPSELLLSKHLFWGVKRELQARGACREIEVEFLSTGDVERYIALEFPENSFPREFAEVIHSRTEGNPLFMVDLLCYLRDRKAVLQEEADGSWRLAQSLPDLSRGIPQSISSVIERKIEQLSERDREVLTAAAVQGYEFDSAVLARALSADGIEIERILDRLERIHAFVKRMGEDELSAGAPAVRYRFVHVLYQDAFYASLTPTRRVVLSASLAQALEALYDGRRATIASQLAFLYETARASARAAGYFLLAAQNAARVFANREAIALARRGLALLGKIPETAERTRKELDLQVTLAFSLLWTRGYASPETGANMARARELCEALDDTDSLFPVIWGLWYYYAISRTDLKSADQATEQLWNLARNLNDRAMLLGAHISLGFSFQHQGKLVESREHFEDAKKLYDYSQHNRYLELYRFDPSIQSESEMVRTLWLLGLPDQARLKMDETLDRARTFGVPLTLAFAQRHAASLHQNLRQPEQARDAGEACMALCDAHGIMLEKAWVSRPYGWAIAQLGRVEEGIQIARAGLSTQLSMGAQAGRPQSLAVLGETLWSAARTQEGLEAVEEGLAVSNRNEAPYYDAELWRLKGELVKKLGKTAEAEDCFQKAIEIARQQAAKSLELRAATSLARLWQKQGKPKAAQKLLGDIYAWFTEGFDTADLTEAKSLLDELS